MGPLRKDPPSIVYLHGDFGTGKTALAKHIARTRFGKEPLIVSGSKFLDPDRFTEEFRIKKLGSVEFLNQILAESGKKKRLKKDAGMEEVIGAMVGSKDEVRQKIVENYLREEYQHSLPEGALFDDGDFQKYAKDNASRVSEKLLKDIDDQLDATFSNQVQGRYVLGAMFQAMKEGRPLIVDEANAITPEVLIAFNDLLTKKVGSFVQTRTEEGGFKLKEGYCVMWTGNTGERYKAARYNDMDPASYSRIVPIKVSYLPQSREVNNMQQLMERLELQKLGGKEFADNEEVLRFVKDSKERAGSDQIFQVLLLKMLNRRMGSEMLAKKDDPYSVIKDIYRLSVASRIVMDMFEGRLQQLPSFPGLEKIIGSSENTVLMKKLKSSNLTMRELIDNIIGGYMDEGESMDIEHYTYKFVQKFATVPEEQAIIYAILQKCGFFSTDEGWPNYQNAKDAGDFKAMMEFNPLTSVSKYKTIRKNGAFVSLLNTDGQYGYSYVSSLESLQLMFGYLPPRRETEYEAVVEKVGGKKKIEVDKARKKLCESLTECTELLSPTDLSHIA